MNSVFLPFRRMLENIAHRTSHVQFRESIIVYIVVYYVTIDSYKYLKKYFS